VLFRSPRPFIYQSPSALPAIPDGVEVLDAMGFDGDIWILGLLPESDEARLFRLGTGDWEETIGFAQRAGEMFHMVEIAGELSVVRLHPDGDSLWTMSERNGAVGFARRSISIEGEIEDVLSVGGRLVVVDRLGDALRVGVMMSGSAGGRGARTVIGFVPEGSRVLDFGGRIGAIWETEDGQLTARVVSLSGIGLFEGPLGAPPVISVSDLQVMVLVLVSGALSVLFFIWRPCEIKGAIDFPEGVALADPSRRVTAWCVDAGLSALLAAIIWRVSPGKVVLAQAVGPESIWPACTAIGFFILHSSIGEAFAGRSIGKALARCRVIDRHGRRPSFGRALLRSFIRGMCPTLGLSIILGGSTGEPWACGTFVVMPVGGDDRDDDAGTDEHESDSDHTAD